MKKDLYIPLSIFTAVILVIPMVLGAQGGVDDRRPTNTMMPAQEQEREQRMGRVHATETRSGEDMRARAEVQANNSVGQTMREQMDARREEIRQQRGSFRERAQERREQLRAERGEMRQALPEQAKQRISDRVTRIANVFQEVLANFNRVADNLERRVDIAENERGFDMSSTTELLSEARAQLDIASEDIEQSISSTTEEVAEEGEVSANSIRTFVELARESMMSARQALNEALQSFGREIAENAQEMEDDDGSDETSTSTETEEDSGDEEDEDEDDGATTTDTDTEE